jgi:hypothetical protein
VDKTEWRIALNEMQDRLGRLRELVERGRELAGSCPRMQRLAFDADDALKEFERQLHDLRWRLPPRRLQPSTTSELAWPPQAWPAELNGEA